MRIVEATGSSDPGESSLEDMDQELDGKDWIPLRDFADMIGRSWQTVAKWKSNGVLNPEDVYLVGGRWRIKVREVMRFQNEGNFKQDAVQPGRKRYKIPTVAES